MLICRHCGEPADSSVREHGNERWTFKYTHRQHGGPPIEHQYSVQSYMGEELAREDREREKQ